ncbi:hypothetical protein SDC9_168226 [bioreactor metagenome]|uniref:Uncharacterized protein n=1 Tax=bioreactor metagenome TaxID=1076179 RepID=A0A645G1X9_9ZZZZ
MIAVQQIQDQIFQHDFSGVKILMIFLHFRSNQITDERHNFQIFFRKRTLMFKDRKVTHNGIPYLNNSKDPVYPADFSKITDHRTF